MVSVKRIKFEGKVVKVMITLCRLGLPNQLIFGMEYDVWMYNITELCYG